MTEVITNNLDLWTSALLTKSTAGRGSNGKLEAYGIKKLREMILELAVRGKLVAQDPTAEPAVKLLELIQRNSASLNPLNTDEAPFEPPHGWVWVRLGDIALIERGGSPRPINAFLTDAEDGLNWIKISDTEKGGKYITSTEDKIRKEGLTKTRMVYPGDFLLTNSMSFGRPYIHPPDILEKDFLYYLLSSPYVAKFFRTAAAGAVVMNLNADKVRELSIPIPHLDEQQQISAKVDELMALCDQLEQQQTNNIEAHQTLVEILLSTLTNVDSQQELNKAWTRIAAHFDTLFTTEQSIDQLKQTILQLAVMGKLVSQDSNDEPATLLLATIDDEKRQLIEAGLIREKDTAAPIPEEEHPFEVPQDWCWARLSEITRRIHYGYTASAKLEIKDIRLLRITDIQNNTVDWLTVPGCEIEEKDLPQYQLALGDILVARTGGTVGKTYLVNDIPVIAVFASYLIRIQGAAAIYDRYLKLFLESPAYWVQLDDGTRGGAQPNVNGQTLGSMVVPVPPKTEQHRIVAKVDELMNLCDTLKARLTDAQSTLIHLADAIVEQAVA
jgi:type I restriction enzyme S subunit